LQLDLEFRFTDAGSNATYYNSILTVTDTTHIPFELWTVEDETQIDVAIYQVAGSKPFYAETADYPGSYEFTKNIFIMPVYQPYSNPSSASEAYAFDADADLIGWMMKFNKGATAFESGNVFQVKFNNPTIPGTDVYSFVGSGLKDSDADMKTTQMDAISVYPKSIFWIELGRNQPLRPYGIFYSTWRWNYDHKNIHISRGARCKNRTYY